MRRSSPASNAGGSGFAGSNRLISRSKLNSSWRRTKGPRGGLCSAVLILHVTMSCLQGTKGALRSRCVNTPHLGLCSQFASLPVASVGLGGPPPQAVLFELESLASSNYRTPDRNIDLGYLGASSSSSRLRDGGDAPLRPSMIPIAIGGLRLFFGLLTACLVRSGKIPVLFTPSSRGRGRGHRLVGAALLCWLVAGSFCVVRPPLGHDIDGWAAKCLAFDFVLGVLGIATTLTAANDFPHRLVVNRKGKRCQ